MKVIAMLNNIRLSVKMLILAGIALVAAATPTTFFVNLETQGLATVAAEVKGLASSRPFMAILQDAQLHRGLAAGALAGNEQMRAGLAQRAQSVSQGLQGLEPLLKQWNDSELQSRYMRLVTDWSTLTSAVRSQALDAPSSFRQHGAWISELLAVLGEVTKLSGLIYDPKPDTYHMIIAAVLEQPQLTEQLGQVRAQVNAALRSATLSLAQRGDIAAHLLAAQQRMDNMLYHLSAAADEDSDVAGLRDRAQALRPQLEDLETLVARDIVQRDNPVGDADTLWANFTVILDAQFGFNREVLELLQTELDERSAQLQAELNSTLTLLALLLVSGAVLGWFIVRSISQAVFESVAATGRIVAGDFALTLDAQRKDEFGELNRAMQSMAAQLAQAAQLAVENARIRQALDGTSVNVMIADNDRNILYMNQSVQRMMRETEADIREALPHFRADRLMGENMDTFHKNPAHQASLLAGLRSSYEGNIVVGKRHFRLTANPIIDSAGKRLGSVVEWLDRTTEVRAEQEIALLVNAAAQGNFTQRINESDKRGFMLAMSQGLNQVVDNADRGLQDVSRVLNALAQGDLTQRIDAEYQGTFEQLKTAANDTSTNLARMIGEIREAVDTINTASSEIASGNSDLSSRTEQQAANLEETASSMEQLTSTVRLNADNAKQATGLASQASSVAVDGGQLIEKVVSTMASINESAQKIADIIGVIDGIAFQTNILALNAAVEAARAGDQGRGFAVVASEVRSLAQRSANAAKDIKALISDSVQKIEDGNGLVNQSGNTMKDIVTSIKRVNDIMAEIAAASAEQSSGIDEIGKAVAQMDEMTQQNAALVEQAAAAAESLQSQADQLATRVASFRIDQNADFGSGVLAAGHSSHARKALSMPQRTLAKPLTKSFDKHSAPTRSVPSRLAKPAAPQDDEWEDF